MPNPAASVLDLRDGGPVRVGPTWLTNAPAALDRAVWAAYGWPAEEVPAEVEEEVILSRLLDLNQSRAGH